MGSEVQFQFGKVYIPESTEKAYVYHERKLRGKPLAKNPNKEIHHAGIWKYDNDIAALQPTQLEVWVFFYDRFGNIPDDVPEHVLENNPNQGLVGYDKHDLEKHLDWKTRATPKQMWFYPPKYRAENDDDVMVKGIWIKPEYKRDLSDLEPNKNGFLNVTGRTPKHKGGKLGVGGGWKMLAVRDQVKKKKKSGDDDDKDKNVKWTIYVRTPNGTTFPVKVIPGNKIFNIKEKIALNKKPLISIPPEEQRLFFLKDPETDIRNDKTQLHDDKTITGSGVRNGDTIDLGPMIVYVRNPRGKKFKFDVDPVEKIESLMDSVQEKEGTPVTKQVLFHKRVRLRPNGKNDLSTYKIKHKDNIDLMPMMIYVETFDGTTIELEVESTYPLELVKKRTRTRTEIPVEEQTLYFEKKFMDSDTKLLRDYNVEHKDTLVMKRGGLKPTSGSGKPASMQKRKGDVLIFVVKDWNNEKFTLVDDIKPKTTILQIKTLIENLHHIPIDKQRLTFKNKSLYNTKTLEQSKIKDRNVLHLEAKKVNVKVPSGDAFSFDVNPNEPIIALLERMELETDIPADKQKLLFNNNPLDPLQTLDDYKIPNNAPLEILVEEPEPQYDVLLLDGTKVVLDNLINKTIGDVKDLLAPITKIPRHQQRLFYLDDDDDSLPADLPLSRSKIPEGGTIKLANPTLEIATPEGKIRSIFVDPEDTLLDVENKVNKKFNLPPDTRLLSPLGDELDPDEPLLNQIMPNQVHQLLPPEISVEVPGGGKVVFPVTPKDTIDDLKKVVEGATGIPATFQRIFYIDPDNGDELPSDTPIVQSQINKGKPIFVAPPSVQVRDSNGTIRNFVLDPEETLKGAQPKIAKKFGMPLDSRVLPEDIEVDPEAPLLDQIDPMTVFSISPNEVEVDVPGTGKIKFPIDRKQSIGDLRDMIEEGLGVPKPFQRIFNMYDDAEPIPDETPLSQVQSKPGREPLKLRQPEVLVVGPDGQPRSFVLDYDDTPADLEEKARRKLNFPLNHRLFRDNDCIDDKKPLSQVVNHGDVLVPSEPINIGIEGKGKIRIPLSQTTSIGDIPDMIAAKIGIPASRLRNFHLDNDSAFSEDIPLSLVENKLENRSIEIRLPELQVVTPDGPRTFVWDFDQPEEAFISSIKKRLGIPLDQRLFRENDYRDIEDAELQGCLKHGDVLLLDRPIEVDILGKGKEYISLLPTQSIGELKTIVEKKNGIPSSRMRIFYMDNDDDELDDKFSLTKSELKPVYGLRILPPEVKIQMPGDVGSRTFIFEFDETIQDFTSKVKNKLNISLDQRLFRDGEEMDPDDPELEKALTHGDVITLEPPDLNIDIAGKGKVSVQFLPTQTIGEIKSIIEEELEINSNRMRIFHLENDTDELDDSTPLAQAGIKPGGMLFMISPEITVQTPDSKSSRTFVLEFGENIGEFAKKVSQKMGFPLHQRLFRDGGYGDIDDADLEQSLTHGDVLTLAPTELEIDVAGRGKVTLQFLPTMTVGDIRSTIEDKLDIPKSRMGRVFPLEREGEELDDNTPLAKKMVKPGDILQMLPPEFVVETKVGNSPRSFVMDMNESVECFQKRVEQETGEKYTPELFLTKLWELDLPEDPELSETESEDDDSYRIQVMHWSGEIFALPNIQANDFIHDVEEQVWKEKQIPKDEQQLTYLGNRLDRKKSLKDQGVVDKSIFVLEEGRQVDVTLPKRKKFTLTIFPTTTMTDVKRVIEEELPDFTASEKQRLFVIGNDDELDDDVPFSKLNFVSGTKFEIRPFVLTIVRHNGESFTVDAKPEEYIEDIKETIEFIKGIPVHRQRLKYHDKEADDALSLKDQNIVHESTLYLEPMQIRVAMPNEPGGGWSIRRELKFLVELDYTVQDLTTMLSENVDICDKCLVFGGIVLTDAQTLVECEIENDDLLSLEYFEVRFMHWDGEEVVVSEINPNDDTMATVKQRLVELTDISMDQLSITYNGRAILDDQTLNDQGISHKSRLVLEPPDDTDFSNPKGERMAIGNTSNPTIQNRDIGEDDIWPDVPDWSRRIFFFDNDESLDSLIEITIMHWDGDTFSFNDLRLRETVDELKERIANLKNVKVAQFKLKAGANTLKGGMSLLSQKVHHKSFITMDAVERRQIDQVQSADKVGFNVMAAKASFSKMKVTIRHWNGDSFKLHCDPLEYIDDVKERIEMMMKIPVDDQRLSFEGSIVDDSLTLKQQKIAHKSILRLEPMQIHVQLVSHGGKQLSFPVEPGHTVAVIKERITQETTLKMDDKSLMFAGDELLDEMTLSECHVDHDDILTLERFTVSVLHWSGEVWPVDNVNPHDTIIPVLNIIRKQKQLEAELHLSFQFKPVDEKRTLREQGIKYKSILVLADTQKMSLPSSPRVTREKVSLVAFSTADLGPKAEMRRSIDEEEKLTIIVEGAKDGVFTVEMDPGEFLDDLRDKIFRQRQIPVELQRLSYEGRPVHDSSTLMEQNIGHQSTLILEPMKIHIRIMPHGKQLTFAVEPDDTLGRIKEIIAKKTAVPLDDRCLLHCGVELKDGQTLSECNIEHDEVITMERFAIKVMHWSGEVVLVENVKQTGTIGHVKEKIRRKFGNLAPSKQELYYEGEYIDEKRTLKEQGIKYKCVLVLEEAGSQGSKLPQKISLSQFPKMVCPSATPSNESPSAAQNMESSSPVRAGGGTAFEGSSSMQKPKKSLIEINQISSSKKEPSSALTGNSTKRYGGSRLAKKTAVDRDGTEKKEFVNNPKIKLDETTKGSESMDALSREEERQRVKISLLALSQESPDESPDEAPVVKPQKPKKSFDVKLPKKKPPKEKSKKQKKPSSIRRIKFSKSTTNNRADNNASATSFISNSDDSSGDDEKKKKKMPTKKTESLDAGPNLATKKKKNKKDSDSAPKTPTKMTKAKRASNSKRIKFTPSSPPKASKAKVNLE